MKEKRARIRFNEVTDRATTIVIGRPREKVVAFEFRNEGSNSLVTILKDGAGVSLSPKEEKPYAVDGLAYFEEEFVVKFQNIVAGAATHRAIITEIYHKD